jgi:hypothetical protein
MADLTKLVEQHRGAIAGLLARADHNSIDEVAATLGLPRDVVNAAAPWAYAELDHTNSDVYDVVMSGGEVEWEFREGPDYYDKDGQPRTGARDAKGELLEGHAEKLRRRALAVVQLRARSSAEAREQAALTHPQYDKVESVKKRG